MFYLLNKEKGISSFKAIKNFAKDKGIKKIGHTGTLDPMAEGLLLVATDDDTKLIPYVDKEFKVYETTMDLCKTSDTYDSEGEVTENDYDLSGINIQKIIMSFEKTYDQIPPSFSAKKVNGKRAYELAREGKEVTLQASKVVINKIYDVKNIDINKYSFKVSVSRGTYIRSLIHDIGKKIGSGAIMSYLKRTELNGLSSDKPYQKVDELDLIKLPMIKKINHKELFQGKPIKIEREDGEYSVVFSDFIVGIIKINDGFVSKRNLFGNKYERLQNESG